MVNNNGIMTYTTLVLCVCMMGTVQASPISTQERRLKAMYHHMAADIARIEEKIWVDLTMEIETLKENLEKETEKRQSLEEEVTSIVGARVGHDGDGSEDVVEGSRQEDLSCTCGALETKMMALQKGFNSVKILSRSYSRDVAEIVDSLSELSANYSEAEARTNDMDRFVQSIAERSVNNAEGVLELKADVSILDGEQQTLHSRITNISDSIAESSDVNPLGEPFFVSEWTPIASQDDLLSDVTIEHGLGAIPLKLDVQVKLTTGPNAGWIFPGDSALQGDDDTSLAYGGVVYFYNETHVQLLTPRKWNNGDAGTVINTGKDNSYWIGPDHQKATAALVRVKVWGEENMSPPDFQTSWLPLDRRRKDLSFYEINHGLDGYPAMVSVQIRVSNSNKQVLSDGMGSLMSSYREWSNAGGVLHGFSDKAIRIWSPFIRDDSKAKNFGNLLGVVDGWGTHTIGAHDVGDIRVSAWSYKPLKINGNILSGSLSHGESRIHIDSVDLVSFDVDKDLVTCYTQAESGVNKDFRFRGWGSSQATTTPFGGVLYAYDELGTVKVWKPNAKTGGYLIHVAAPNGDGQIEQSTNEALVLATVIKAG